jgi:hypothetical protein
MTEAAESRAVISELAHLLGGATVRRPSRQPVADGGASQAPSGDEISVTLEMPSGTTPTETFILKRTKGTFSNLEVRLCDQVAKGASALWKSFDAGRRLGHIRTAVNESALTIGIARMLRAHTGSFWSISILISLFKSLTFCRYEGKPCTSGILCLQGSSKDIASHLSSNVFREWRFEAVASEIPIDQDFFARVGSYRYVDGVAKYYVSRVKASTDEPATLIGTMELRKRNLLSVTDLTSYAHLRPLLVMDNAFAMVANRNSEIDIIANEDGGHLLRWTRGRWRAINVALIIESIDEVASSKVAKAVAGAALTLSHLRYGTLILVPDDAEDLPEGGSIDRSDLGKALRKQIRARKIFELIESGQFLNALSSDGLTAVAGNGRILDTGRILSDVRLGKGKIGGARTAAARAASKKGLVLKVSADGPISLFRDGQELYETA